MTIGTPSPLPQHPHVKHHSIGNVFISYSHDDEKLTHQIHAELSKLDRDVWVDWEDIEPTDDWLTDIYNNIQKTDTFVFVVSPRSITSVVCNLEIAHATRLNKRLVPIIANNVDFDKVIQEVNIDAIPKVTYALLGQRDLKDLMRENWKAITVPNWLYFRDEGEVAENFPKLINAIDKNLKYVREHTRWLGRAVEWNDKARNTSFLLSGAQLREAEVWLTNSGEIEPFPTELQKKYIFLSRQRETRRIGIWFIVIMVALVIIVIAANRQLAATAESNARATSVVNEQIALNNAATAIVAQNIAEARGTEVANQVVIAANNAGTAQANAVIAGNNAVTATIAQGEAILQAATAQKAATAESQARATSVINEQNALNNAATAIVAQGVAERRGTEVAQQAATAQANAVIAGNNAATATIAQGEAIIQAATAQKAATAESQARATSVVNAENAVNNAATAVARGTEVAQQALIAANNAATAQANAQIAQNNAATATVAQGQAIIQADNAMHNAATAVVAQEQAIIQANNAVNNAATATIAQGQAVVEAAKAATQAANAQNAQATSVVNERIAINNAATATVAQGQVQEAATAELDARATSVAVALEATFAQGQAQIQADNASTQVALAATAIVAQGQAVAAQSTAEKRSNEAQSVGLTVASEQLVGLGNTDLALVLALEAVKLDPKSWVAQSRLLTIAFAPGTRLVFKSMPMEPTPLPVSNSEVSLHPNAVTHLAYSPDGNFVASSSVNGSITIWDAHTGNEIRRLSDHKAAVNSVDFSPDSKMLISASDDKSLILWDVASGQNERQFRLRNALGEDLNRPAQAAVFRPDGKTIVSGWDDGQVVVFDTDSGYDRIHLIIAKGPITHLSLGPDPKLFLAISTASIAVWDSKEAKRQQIFLGGSGVGAYSPDGNSILTSATSSQIDNPNGNDLILRDMFSTRELKHYRGHTKSITDVAFIQKGAQALSTSQDGTIILWDIESQKVLHQYHGNGKPLTSLAVSPDGYSFVSGDEDGEIRLWDVESDGTKTVLPEAQNTVLKLQYSHDTQTILASYDDKSVGVQNAADGIEGIRRFYHADVITSFAYSPDEKNLLTADASGTVQSWNISNYSHIYDFSAQGGSAVAAYSPDGKTVVTGNKLGWLRFWNALTGDRTTIHEPDAGPIIGILYFKDGSRLLTLHPKALVIRDSQTGNVIRQIPSTLNLSRMTLSSDERYLLTSSGSDVILWDLTTEKGTPKIFGGDGEPHTKLVTDLAFSPDGTTALSSSEDGTIRLWDVLNGRLLFVYSHNKGIPHGVVFNPDGLTFIASYDRQIVVFWSGTRSAIGGWIQKHRYLVDLTCPLRERYSVSPLCNAEGTLPPPTPTGTQQPTPIPTATLAPSLNLTATDVPPILGRISSQGRVNVRADRSNDSALLAQLNNGELVTVLDDVSQTPGWVHIRTQSGIEGWVSDQLIRVGDLALITPTIIPSSPIAIEVASATPTPLPTALPTETPMPIVTLQADRNGNINIRSGPGNDFKLVARVPSGTAAFVVDAPFGLAWTRIRLEDGTEGWVLRVVVKQ